MKTAEPATTRGFTGLAVLGAVLTVVLSPALFAQTAVNFKAQSRDIDFTGAPFTRPVKTGTALPATCSVGDLFFNTSAPAGQNLYGCPVANSWTVLSGAQSGLADPGTNGIVERNGAGTTTAVGSASAPLQAQNIEAVFYADQFATVQAAVTAAGTNGIVVIPSTYAGTASWTNPNNVVVLDYRSSTTSVYNARNWGCKGDGVTDDTACLTAFFAFVNSTARAVAYLPSGKYLVNGTLRITSSMWLRGDGYEQSFLVETNPTSDLLIVTEQTHRTGGWSAGPVISDLGFAGEGPATTGNLLVNAVGGRATFTNLGFWGTGGRGILIESERGMYNDIHFSHVRQAMVAVSDIGINESYLRNFTIMDPGLAINDLGVGPAGSYCYNVNSNSSGVYPSSGAVQQDPHFTVDLGSNVVNFEITDGSIKPTTCLGGIHAHSVTALSVSHVYFEGYNNGSINPDVSYGGNHEKTTLSSAITASQTTFDIANGQWMIPFVGNSSDLITPETAPGFVIRPPDYLPGSTAASSLGNGITRGTYEYVLFEGIVHDTNGSGWHAYVTTRGSSSTTAVAWPAGAIFEDAWGSPGDPTITYPGEIRLADDHLNSVLGGNGYTVTCNNGNEQTCGEVVIGVEPDAFFVPGTSNMRNFLMGIRLDGQDQMFCSTSPEGVIDTYMNAIVDFRGMDTQGSVVDAGGTLGSSGTLSAALVGGCNILREVFASGWGTYVEYFDPSSSLQAWGPANSAWHGYSLSGFGAANGNQPTMFIPIGDAFHVSGYGSTTPLPWDWALSTGLQQTSNGTALFGVDASGNVSTPGSVTATRSITHIATVTFSSTPQFDLSQGDQLLTLTGNVTSSALANIAAGQRVTFKICQDSTGGRTFAWPSAVHGATTISTAANSCTVQQFESFDGAILNATGPGVANQ